MTTISEIFANVGFMPSKKQPPIVIGEFESVLRKEHLNWQGWVDSDKSFDKLLDAHNLEVRLLLDRIEVYYSFINTMYKDVQI